MDPEMQAISVNGLFPHCSPPGQINNLSTNANSSRFQKEHDTENCDLFVEWNQIGLLPMVRNEMIVWKSTCVRWAFSRAELTDPRLNNSVSIWIFSNMFYKSMVRKITIYQWMPMKLVHFDNCTTESPVENSPSLNGRVAAVRSSINFNSSK